MSMSKTSLVGVVASDVERARWGWALPLAFMPTMLEAWPILCKLSMAEGAIRSEYIAQIKLLRQEVQTLRIEEDKLRTKIRKLHDLLSGPRQQNIAEQAAVIRDMPAMSNAARDAARRVTDIRTRRS